MALPTEIPNILCHGLHSCINQDDPPTEGRPWVCVDLDGTLAVYDGWHGDQHFGGPITDRNGVSAVSFCRRLAETHNVNIFTTRGHLASVLLWLTIHGVTWHAINSTAHNPSGCSGKPIAVAYVDDRAVRFDGDYEAALVAVVEMH